MTEAELIELINRKRTELDENRSANVSKSLLRVQEEEISELEFIFATGEAERLDRRILFDQCAEKFDMPSEQGYAR
jgi:hypothetical protein